MTNEEKRKEIGRRIKKRRKELRWTQKELADRVHKVEGSIRQYENGLRMPDETTKVAIANALGVPYLDLFVVPNVYKSPEEFWEDWNKPPKSSTGNNTGSKIAIRSNPDGSFTNELVSTPESRSDSPKKYRFEADDLSEREKNVFESIYSLLRDKDAHPED